MLETITTCPFCHEELQRSATPTVHRGGRKEFTRHANGLAYCVERWEAEKAEKRAASARKAAATRAARKVEEDAKAASLKPVRKGDIFVSSWGYDQTNVDFYEVVKVNGPRTVQVVKIGQCVDYAGSGSDRVVPDRRNRRSEPMTKRLRPQWYNEGWAFKVASYADAYTWDGSPRHQTAEGWGH